MTGRPVPPLAIERDGLTRLHWAAVVLAVATGLVHLVLGVGALPAPLGVASLLAAGGFAAGVALLLAGCWRSLVLALGIPFTASQILAWYLLNEPAGIGDVSPLAAFDKTVQPVLIAVLALLLYRERVGGRTDTVERGGV